MRLTLWLLLLAACAPADPAETCPPHVDALRACYEAADVEVPEGRTVEDLCAEDVLLDGDAYLCMTEAWEAGDCATDEGLVAIGVAVQRCIL